MSGSTIKYAVEGLEFNLNALHFKCVALFPGGLVAIASLTDGCCVNVLSISKTSQHTQVVTAAPGFRAAAHLLAEYTVRPNGAHTVSKPLAWDWKGITVPALNPAKIPGSDGGVFYATCARTLSGVVGRRTTHLDGSQARIRVVVLEPAEFSPANFAKKVREDSKLSWETQKETHVAANGSNPEQLRALIARGVLSLLEWEHKNDG